MLVEYVRDYKRNKIGAIVAICDDKGEILIGWSKCHVELDKFDKNLAKKIALNRTKFWGIKHINVPKKYHNKMKFAIEGMYKRAVHYYKQANKYIDGIGYIKSSELKHYIEPI